MDIYIGNPDYQYIKLLFMSVIIKGRSKQNLARFLMLTDTNGYPSPIQPDKASTDKDYNAAITYCVENVDQIGVVCGTHNETITIRTFIFPNYWE